MANFVPGFLVQFYVVPRNLFNLNIIITFTSMMCARDTLRVVVYFVKILLQGYKCSLNFVFIYFQ